MARNVVHIQARRSWWAGKRTSMCGQEFDARRTETTWFAGPKCPDCKRAEKAQKDAKKNRARR